jgi:hypothetical protein
MMSLRSWIGLSVVLGAAALSGGCGTSREYFRPRENQRAQSPLGHPAAQYTMQAGEKPWADVKVWSEGAWVPDDDDERTILHVGLEIENRTDATITLDAPAARIENMETSRGPVGALRPLDVDHAIDVGPKKVGLIDLEFALPAGVRPRQIESFRFTWGLSSETHQHDENTPFRRDLERRVRAHSYSYAIGFGYPLYVHHGYWHSPWHHHFWWHRCW